MKKRTSKTIMLLPIAILMVGCALIYTTDRYLFKFSHKTHLDLELDCTECHKTIEESTKAQDNNLPLKKECCGDCHDVQEEEGCVTCHSSVEKARKLTPRETGITFSHKLHIQDYEIECKTCHTKVDRSTKSTEKLTPNMDSCGSCHEIEYPASNCGSCHLNLKDLTNHKDTVYKKTIGYCLSCHKDQTCLSCHEGRIDKNVHDRNFRYYHSLQARSNPTSCDVCHRRKFCKECH